MPLTAISAVSPTSGSTVARSAAPRFAPRAESAADAAGGAGEEARRVPKAVDRDSEPDRPMEAPRPDPVERVAALRRGEGPAETVALLGRLRSRDAEVRAHESAHIATGGRYVRGGASYSYQKGPDGRNYAVGGEVGIDTAPVRGDPAETARKMRTVRAAALAPAEPSGADLAVAAAAAQAEAQAVAELASAAYAREARGGSGGGSEDGSRPADPRGSGLDMLI